MTRPHFTKSLPTPHPKIIGPSQRAFNPKIAGQAIADGLQYLKNRWEWSGSQISRILHLPSNTVNTWLKNGMLPLSHSSLQPDIQAVLHLLAIHRSLEAMFENSSHQTAWLSTHH